MNKKNSRIANGAGTAWFAAKAVAFASLCTFGMQPMIASAQATLPISVAQGQGATLGTSSNGTTVVNIAAPNQSGVSNNVMSQYNVGTSGVVLNNSGQAVQTQIGGTVQGNTALGQNAANLILMQVNGGAATQMLGTTEIAGKGANLVVANPAGITCSGCNFLNAPRVTLTTGTPVMDPSGALAGIYVQDGSIAIDGKGLTASDSAVDLISRAMTINGAVQAKSIDAIAGVNQVDYDTKTVKAVNGSYNKPEVAIDVQALGSMYGNGAVRLIATEAGVGVRDNGKISSLNGDITVSSKGDISIGAPGSISNASAVSLNGVNVNNQGKIASDGVRVEATRGITNSGAVEGRNITMNASDTLTNSGSLNAGNGLFLTGARKVTLDGGSASAGGALYASGSTVSNRNATLKGGTVNIDADRVDNANGTMSSTGALTVNASSVDNTKGKIKSDDVVTMNAKTVLNEGGEIAGAKGTKTPDQGGKDQPTQPDQGNVNPQPDQGTTPVDPSTDEMVTLLTLGGETFIRRSELSQLPDLVYVGDNRYVPRQFLAKLGYDENGQPVAPSSGNAGPVNPAPVDPAPVNPVQEDMVTLMLPGGETLVRRSEISQLPDLVKVGEDRYVPRPLLAMFGYDESGKAVTPPSGNAGPVNPAQDDMVMVMLPGGETPMRRSEMSQFPDLVQVGENRYVPRQFLSTLGYAG